MEPDKTYPLHPDENGASAAASKPPSINLTNDQSPDAPSSHGGASASPAEVPWYLRPLTKTTASPLTSTQTRPFMPREPLPPSQQRYQSQNIPPQQVNDAPVPSRPPQAQPQSAPADTLSPVVKAPPLSPFRSRPVALPPVNTAPNAPGQAYVRPQAAQYQMPAQSSPQQPGRPQASSSTIPKPFSQFGRPSLTKSAYADSSHPKSSRKLIGIIAAVLLVGLIGAGVYALWNVGRSNNPASGVIVNAEDRFFAAIESHLATGKVRQVYEQTVTGMGKSTFNFDATSDFTDPRNPKSLIKYDFTSGEGDAASEGAGEIIARDANEYYGKLTKPAIFYEGSDASRPQVNQWYSIAADDYTGALLVDPLGARTSINSPLGEIPIGNFNDRTRQELIQFIKSQGVYKIKSSKDATLDGKKMTQYTIDFDVTKVNELNARIAGALGSDTQGAVGLFTGGDAYEVEVWVGHDTTRIERIKIDRSSTDGDNVTKEVTTIAVSYPDDVAAISKPDGVIAAPW